MMDESGEMEGRPGDYHPLEGVALKRLCSLLRNNAHTVLNGEASFTLTTEVLNRLNGDFRRHSISLTENEQRPPSACEVNSWRPLRRVLATLKKSDQRKEKEREEWMQDIQFVKDFMLSTPTLKVIHRQRTLSFPVSLRRFGNLSVLEVRKVPVHLMEGLQTVRGTLQSLTFVRSVPNLKELLESCGGDRSAPLTWARLKFLSVVFNDIRHLDDSLRFVSHLEHLDLSHNQIDNTDHLVVFDSAMSNLLDVSVVNVSYNKMAAVPSFSLTTRGSLTALFLRGNQLDNLRGLECLTCLEVVDMGENYLVDHTALLPIKGLHKLRKLLLDMNPLFYHRRHRRLTVCYLSPRAMGSQFVLDNKRLSGSEIGAYNPHVALKTSPRPHMSVGGVDQLTANTWPFRDNLQIQASSSSSGLGTLDNSSEVIVTSTPKKGGKRKRLKARDTEIRDLDTSGDFSSSLDVATPGGSPSVRNLERQMREKREEALRTQKEVETLREVYGSNWLQAIQDKNIFHQPSKSTASPTDTEGDNGGSVDQGKDELDGNARQDNGGMADVQLERPRSGECPTEDELYLTDTNVDPVANPIMAAIAKMASGHSENEEEKTKTAELPTFATRGEVVGSDLSPLGNSGAELRQGSSDKNNATLHSLDRSADVSTARKKLDFGHDEEVNLDTGGRSNGSSEGSGLKENKDGRKEWSVGSVRPEADAVGDNSFKPSEGRAGSSKGDQTSGRPMPLAAEQSTDKSTSEMDSSTDNSLQVAETEGESEPIFVTLPESEDSMIIVTTTQQHILEKDVRGKVKEKLDIRSLVSMATKKMSKRRQCSDGQGERDGEEDKGNNPGVKMVLKFSYVRKDRRRRCYLLDTQDAENLRDILQPFLDAKEEEEKRKKSVIMQCLKCNRSFQKKDVVHRNKALPTSGSTKDLKVIKELMETPTLICPRCGSTILIEVEVPDSASRLRSRGSTAETASQGSHSSNGSSNADIWQQLQLLQQHPPPPPPASSSSSSLHPQHQNPMPRKPAPMLRNRSFDHYSPQASLAARVARTRNSSQTSADGVPVTRRANLAAISLAATQTQSSSDGPVEGRGRSNAFTATGQGHITQREGGRSWSAGEILHVEDHFASDDGTGPGSPNQRLADMTKSVRGDLAGRPVSEDGEGAVDTGRTQQTSHGAMSDSGFESGLYSSSLGRDTGGASHRVEDDLKTPTAGTSSTGTGADSSIHSVGNKGGNGPDGQKGGKEEEEDKERETLKPREKSVSDSKVATANNKHKSLAAMAHLVNSLVSEGKDLEEKEMQKKAECESVQSFYSDDGRKSTISVSELRKFLPLVSSPVHRPSASSVDSDILPVRKSPSGNSIAVLRDVEEGGNGSDDSGGGKAAQFVVGSFENSYEELSPYTTRTRVKGEEGMEACGRIVEVSSPLSSSICNSMVSSVYENVVTTDQGDHGGHDPLVARSSVDSVGSEIVRFQEEGSGEDEDVPSIYDCSMNRKRISHKAKPSKSKSSVDVYSGMSGSHLEGVVETSSYSDILDRVSTGGLAAGGRGQDNEPVLGHGHMAGHPKLGRQSSYSEQLYSNPDLLERSYGSPTLGGIIREPTAGDLYEDDGYVYDDEDGVGGEEDEDEEETYVEGAQTTAVTYRFDRLDHRLTLYLMMTLFENHEEFLCKISSECVAYMMEESYPSLLVMSSCRFYVLKVTDPDTSQEPAKWLTCVEIQPIPELRYVDVGLGGQSLRLEFVTDCSSYTLVTRNRNKTIQFVEVLHNHLAHYAVSQGITSNVVVNEDVDQATLDNLNGDVLSRVVADQPLLLYVMGFIERGHYKKFPVSFVVTPSEVCLVRTNHQWPQPRLQAPVTTETTGKQFTVLERQKINNVASMEVCEMTLRRVRLELFNETEGVSTIWNITMATKQSTFDLIQAVSEPWAREFGVDMDISYSVLDFGGRT